MCRLKTFLKGRGGKAFYEAMQYMNKDRTKQKKNTKGRYKAEDKLAITGIPQAQHSDREVDEMEENDYLAEYNQLKEHVKVLRELKQLRGSKQEGDQAELALDEEERMWNASQVADFGSEYDEHEM